MLIISAIEPAVSSTHGGWCPGLGGPPNLGPDRGGPLAPGGPGGPPEPGGSGGPPEPGGPGGPPGGP